MELTHALHRIETQELHPDYVFVLYREGLQYDAAKKDFEYFQEANFVELTPDRPIVLDLIWAYFESPADKQRTRERAYLIIVRRNRLDPDKTAMDFRWNGDFFREFDGRETVPSWSSGDITITYCVQRAESGDGLEIVRTSANPLRQWFAAAIFLAASVVIGGVWFIRRAIWPRSLQTPTKAT